jgi:hypothetical protein
MSPLQDWLADRRGRAEAVALLRSLNPILGDVFGEGTSGGPNPHVHSYSATMPMRSLLDFVTPSGGPDPDERLAAMLHAVSSC